MSADTVPADPGELDAWLADREAATGDVRPGAEARIVWADEARRRTPLSLVYLHGFSASPMETAPLCDRVAGEIGANLFYARLAGHGRTPQAMGEARVEDWLADGETALEVGRRLGERVVLVGCSTGATLATWLAARGAADIAGIVLLSPNFGPRDPRSGMLLWPGARTWVPWIVGGDRVIEPENDAHARGWTTRYPNTSLIPMMQLVRLVDRSPLERIEVPVLALWSDDDEVVDARRTRSLLRRLAAASVTAEAVDVVDDPAVPNPSRHVLVGDAFGPAATAPTAERIVRWLRESTGA